MAEQGLANVGFGSDVTTAESSNAVDEQGIFDLNIIRPYSNTTLKG
jgi:hypothetical protein